MTPATSIILLAAGLSRRFGPENKLLQPFLGHETLLEATLTTALSVATDDVVMVTGHDHEIIAPLVDSYPVRVVYNGNFASGMGSSIKTGVQTTHPGHSMMIWPADMPSIQSDTIASLMSHASPTVIVRPTYRAVPGHPVVFGVLHRGAILEIDDSSGAQSVLEEHHDQVVRVAVSDPGVTRDFDTPEDFLRASSPSSPSDP